MGFILPAVGRRPTLVSTILRRRLFPGDARPGNQTEMSTHPSTATRSATSPPRPYIGRRDDALLPLVAEMARGGQEALGGLYDATAPLVHGLALRMLEKGEDAEEVVTDVFMKAWRNAASYVPERGSVQGWLLTMTRTIAIDKMRKNRNPALPLETEDGSIDPVSAAPSPEQETDSALWRRRVTQALAALPPEQQQAVRLAFFSGLSHTELAGRLGQPLGTIKTRVRAGLRRMRQTLGEPLKQ